MTKRDSIKGLLRTHPGATAPWVARKLSLSRQMANKYLRELCDQDLAHKIGSTRNTKYFLGKAKASNPMPSEVHILRSLKNLLEDTVFEEVSAKMRLRNQLSPNCYRIAYYSFSEMLNNAIDHSKSKSADIDVKIEQGSFKFTIRDTGIGLFAHVRKYFKLQSDFDALEHILKGKQTTMPSRHSGQGIFFTSRIADRFEIRSGKINLIVDNTKQDYLVQEARNLKGTEVQFFVKAKTRKSLKELFEKFSNDDFEFDKNQVRVKLSSYTELISRSQARRLLSGLEKFKRIVFDFSGVKGIGQAFADEIFRVFPKLNPGVTIEPENANSSVIFMIGRTRSEIVQLSFAQLNSRSPNSFN